MYAVSVEIVSAGRDLSELKAYLTGWVRRHVQRYSGDHPDLAKQEFEVNRTFEHRVYGAVASSHDGRRWAARLQHAQEDDHQKIWRTEVSLHQGSDARIMLAARVSYSGSADTAVRRRAPSFIRGLQRDLGCVLFDGDELSNEPWQIESPQDVSDVLELIADPERVLPVIVVSEPSPLTASDLASAAFGYAHTVALPSGMTEEFRRAITLPWSVYGGAIRTYPAGLDLASPDVFVAPVASRNTIQTRTFANLSGPQAFKEFLLDAAAAASARRLSGEDVILSYSEIRRESVEERRAAVAGGRPELAVEALDEERNALIARVADLEELNVRMRQENADFELMYDRMEARVTTARQEVHALVVQRAALQDALAAAGKPVPELPIPDQYDAMDEWVRTYFAGRLVVTPRALRGAGESIYPGVATVYNGLRFLGDEYHRMRINGADGDVYDRDEFAVRIKELGFRDLSRSAGETTYTKHYEEYHATVFGEPVRLDWHLRKGSGFDGRECLRIYFGWHDAEKVVVVGWMTTHLTNSKS